MLVLALPRWFPLRALLALLLGALHAASFVDDATWPLQLAALAGLVALSDRAAREAGGRRPILRAAWGGARAGFAFGMGWFLVGVSWIYISLHTYGEMPFPIAGLAIVLFCGYLSIYPALAAAGFAAFRAWRPRAPGAFPGPSVAVFAGLWTFAELGRGYVFTGFPWLASGYAHVGGPLSGYAPLIGVYGVSLAAAAVAAALGLARATRRPRAGRALLLPTIAIVVGLPLAGALLARIDWTTPIGRPITVRLLQGNVSQDIKFDESRFEETSEAYLRAVTGSAAGPGEAGHADLVVLPETAFPVFLSDLPEEIAQRLARDAREQHMEIAFGIPINDGHDRYFNSVIAISARPATDPGPTSGTAPAAKGTDEDPLAGVTAQRYDKSHLVPFGEFIPFGFHWFVDLMKMPLGDFTRGAKTQRPMTLAGLKVAFNVCYEDLFGEEIIRQLPAANVLINVSNVAWFGDSMALPQHLDISRMRSIETGRPMLRATNTGMTASIDPHGRVLARLAPFTAGALEVSVQGMQGSTPFARFGNAGAAALALLAVLSAVVVARRPLAGVTLRQHSI